MLNIHRILFIMVDSFSILLLYFYFSLVWDGSERNVFSPLELKGTWDKVRAAPPDLMKGRRGSLSRVLLFLGNLEGENVPKL